MLQVSFLLSFIFHLFGEDGCDSRVKPLVQDVIVHEVAFVYMYSTLITFFGLRITTRKTV
uniref:Uncharacterized protein n=1 Tax=Nelumbo nucifera TaxID=4432 RepID=A0A822XFQ7_NELNU|nr:TPA_asm: hypothetical protein HUJ06_019404 [Nelumbo nucifera]